MWEHPDALDTGAPAAPAFDDGWIEACRSVATASLRDLGAGGSMEATFAVAGPLVAQGPKRLFEAAQAAQVPGTGWPIGAVLPSSAKSRPRLSTTGIEAEIIDKSTQSYDYWALRTDGAFYFLRSLEEEPGYLLADDRVERTAELLLYCQRLYSFLGVDKTVRVRIAVSYAGLAGRALGCRAEDDPDALRRVAGITTEDRVANEAVVEVGAIGAALTDLVRTLTRPLFLLFYFYELPEPEYSPVVGKCLSRWGFAR